MTLSPGLSVAAAIGLAALIACPVPVLAVDEQCRWEKCDFPLMSAGKSLKTICKCYRTECQETTPTLECGCEEARENKGRALDDKGEDAGRIDITISPDTLPAKGGLDAKIMVDVDLTAGRTDVDGSFRVAASSGTVSPEAFTITGRKGPSPQITYQAAADAAPGDVMITVFGGWAVILLGQATGTVYEGKACLLLR